MNLQIYKTLQMTRPKQQRPIPCSQIGRFDIKKDVILPQTDLQNSVQFQSKIQVF